MPRNSSIASVYLDVDEEPRELPRQEPDAPFRILVAGNFSSGASRIRKPILIDRDSFEEVLERFGPASQLAFDKAPIPIAFHELDDFHPDRLFERLPPFRALRDLRQQLVDGVLPAAEPEVAGLSGAELSGADLIAAMMGEEPEAPPAKPRSAWDALTHDIVAPYTEPKPDRRQPAMIAQTDEAIAAEMRAVLHHKEFQSLEALWRGLFFLIRRLETGPDLKVYLWDMPQAELASPEGLAAFRRVAVDETVGTPGADTWSAIAGLYYFGNEHESALGRIAAIARAAGAPFLAAVAKDVVGSAQVFPTLRRSPDARWLGLAIPRFLLRLPYGAKTDSTEAFAFEEMPEAPEHEHYLWGNPAIACVTLLGEAFARSGWSMRPGEVNHIDGLPLHVYRKDGESELKPCAEVLLTESSAELLMELGLMPLLSMKGSDQVRLARFQSIADPPTALSGRWE